MRSAGPRSPPGDHKQRHGPGSGGWHGRGVSLLSKAGDGACLLSECAGLPGGPVTSPPGGTGGVLPHLRHGIGYRGHWTVRGIMNHSVCNVCPKSSSGRCAREGEAGGTGRCQRPSWKFPPLGYRGVGLRLAGGRAGAGIALGSETPYPAPVHTTRCSFLRQSLQIHIRGPSLQDTSPFLLFLRYPLLPCLDCEALQHAKLCNLILFFSPLTDTLQGKYLQNFLIPDRMPTESEFSSSALENCHAGALGSCTFTKAPFALCLH